MHNYVNLKEMQSFKSFFSGQDSRSRHIKTYHNMYTILNLKCKQTRNLQECVQVNDSTCIFPL